MASTSRADSTAHLSANAHFEMTPVSSTEAYEQTAETIKSYHDTHYTEGMIITKQNLTKVDVASLILNKMIGTGIFTTPGFVLIATNSKGLSMGLWALGGLYCFLALFVYLDYGTALPFNGGELIYLSKVWPWPTLASAVVFAGFYISLGHTAGNAVAFSRHIILAAQSTPFNQATSSGDSIDLDARLVKSFAIVALGLVCILLWVSPKMGLFLNRTLAGFKIFLLLFVGFAGIAARTEDTIPGTKDWTPSDTGFQSTSGLIYIIYSYIGWENANYVIGEIRTKRRDLQIGALSAVTLVTFLYFLVNMGYFCAVPSALIQDPQSDIGLAVIFADTVFGNGHTTWLKVCIAISAIGNLIAVAYTSSKVKQAVALQRFIPFPNFFGKDSNFGTPGGALMLHWACSSIVILAMPNTSDGYGFVLGLFTYGQLLVGIALGLGLPRLKKQMGELDYGRWNPFISAPWAMWVCGSLLASINFVILLGAAYGSKSSPSASNQSSGATTPRYWWPGILGLVVVGAIVWLVGLKLLRGGFGTIIGWTAEVIRVKEMDELTQMQADERRDGAETKVIYDVPERRRLGKMIAASMRFLEKVKEKTY